MALPDLLTMLARGLYPCLLVILLSSSHTGAFRLLEEVDLKDELRSSQCEDHDANRTSAAQSPIFVEYIGITSRRVYLKDVPVDPKVSFHFVMGYACDNDRLGNVLNGEFRPYWSESLTPEAVDQMKRQHSNVKVLMSLGGWGLWADEPELVWWEDVTNTEKWIDNAEKSITQIVQKYNLDGIDIEYENIKPTTASSFVKCIGETIARLKQKGVITVVSISPIATTNDEYVNLWNAYSCYIDIVNYQMFSDYKISTSAGFVTRFNELAKSTYGYPKLLASFVVRGGAGLPYKKFTEAVKTLQAQSQGLLGISSYSADEGYANKFLYEKKLQELVASKPI